MRIGGIKCLSYTRFSVIGMGKDSSVVRTSEGSVATLLTALLFLKYLDRCEIEVIGISGNMRKAKEICQRIESSINL
ncbi:MAG: hypothetical protein NZ992_04785 [Candidatus Korarchaeum sp.]|nr:hypothetical protein [Candidatus Korarchaeum sp.]MDW8036139.1 hypothetical protein [Candidatus Korarchaeum sp.]